MLEETAVPDVTSAKVDTALEDWLVDDERVGDGDLEAGLEDE